MRNSQPTRGATFEFNGTSLVVAEVKIGGAADQAGLESGDRIVTIFGMPLTGCLCAELIEALKGPCLLGIVDHVTGRQTNRWIDLGGVEAEKSERLSEPTANPEQYGSRSWEFRPVRSAGSRTSLFTHAS